MCNKLIAVIIILLINLTIIPGEIEEKRTSQFEALETKTYLNYEKKYQSITYENLFIATASEQKNLWPDYCGLIVDEYTGDQEPLTLDLVPPSHWDCRDATYNGITGNWITPVRDQGVCGSCWAFGSLGAMEAAYKIYKRKPDLDIDFSEQYMVSCVEKNCTIGGCNAGGCKGYSFYKTLKWIKQNGAIPESCFPYQAIDAEGCNYYNCDFPPVTCDQKCNDWQENIVEINNYRILNDDPQTIKNALILFGPLFIGIGNHAVTLIGYNDNEESPEEDGYWIYKNSWGENYGENGYGKLYYSNEPGIGSVAFFEFEPIDIMITRIIDVYHHGSILTPEESWYATEEKINFEGYTMGGNGDYSWLWNFGDGTIATTPEEVNHKYTEPGIYNVILTVTDSKGNSDSDNILVDIRINNPPSKPIIVSYPTEVTFGKGFNCILYTTDADNDPLQYWYTVPDCRIGGWESCTNFYLDKGEHKLTLYVHDVNIPLTIKIRAIDIHGIKSEISEIEIENVICPPKKPDQPSGLLEVNPSEEYAYTSKTKHECRCMDEEIFYLFDWGDGTQDGWLGPYSADEEVTAYHLWEQFDVNPMEIKVKAKYENGYESSWSEPLSVNKKSKSKLSNRVLNSNILQKLQNTQIRLFTLIQYLLQPPVFKNLFQVKI